MNKSHRVSDDEIKVAEMILLNAGFIEAEYETDGYPIKLASVPLGGAQYVLEMVGDYIDKLKFQTFFRPHLAKVRRGFALRLGDTINRVKNCNASEKS